MVKPAFLSSPLPPFSVPPFPQHSPRSPRCQLHSPASNIPTRLPVLILPGLGNSSIDYIPLAQSLCDRGHAVSIVPLARWQWSLNALGFLLPEYWRGTLRPEQVLGWYFGCIERGIDKLCKAYPQMDEIHFVGHSAGGWLARAYLAEHAPEDVKVERLVTLGTPNQPPPEGVLDQMRGLLGYVEKRCQVEKIKVREVLCVAGRGTFGRRFGEGSFGQLIAFASYWAVCGKGEVEGDGVTPMEAACCTGGKLVVCECEHSMLTGKGWYGDGEAFETWSKLLS